jgi:hypothetical protein
MSYDVYVYNISFEHKLPMQSAPIYYHQSCEFESHSWRDVLDAT